MQFVVCNHVFFSRREQGVVSSLMDGFGYITCSEKDQRLIFRFSEVLRLGQELTVGDEVSILHFYV